MRFRRKEPEVLVSGAGPVGMFAALCLAERDLDFRVVDKDVRPASHSYALALHPRSIETLLSFGLDPKEIESGGRVEAIVFCDEREPRATLRLDALGGAYPHLVVLRQSRIEQLLRDLMKDAHRRVEWTRRVSSVEMDDEGVRVTVDHLDKVSSGYAVAIPEWQVVHRTTVRPTFVIGADGAESIVRHGFGVEMEQAGPPTVFAVFEFDSDYALGSEVRVVLGDGVTSVVWPLPDGKVRWGFELPGGEAGPDSREKSRYAVQTDAERQVPLHDDMLRELLAERAPWFDSPPGEITWATVVKFDRRIAARFAGSRFGLCGDAAHLIGPIGIQSMNLGFLEVQQLVEHVAGVLRKGASADLPLEYERRWRREWRFLLGLEGELAPGARTDPWIAANRSRIRECLPGCGEDYRHLAGQLELEVRRETPAETS